MVSLFAKSIVDYWITGWEVLGWLNDLFVETGMNKEVEGIRGKMEYMEDQKMLIYTFAV